jgi:hypothetical protein
MSLHPGNSSFATTRTNGTDEVTSRQTDRDSIFRRKDKCEGGFIRSSIPWSIDACTPVSSAGQAGFQTSDAARPPSLPESATGTSFETAATAGSTSTAILTISAVRNVSSGTRESHPSSRSPPSISRKLAVTSTSLVSHDVLKAESSTHYRLDWLARGCKIHVSTPPTDCTSKQSNHAGN